MTTSERREGSDKKIGRKAFGPRDRKQTFGETTTMRLLNQICEQMTEAQRASFTKCFEQASKIVSHARAQAPAGFDPQNAELLIADVFVPELHWPYVMEETARTDRFIQAGVAVADAEFAKLASGAGRTVDMPFWKDLDGADENISDTGALTTAKPSTAADRACKHFRAKAWSDNDMAGILATGDREVATNYVISRQAKYWTGRQEQILLSTLEGVFAAASMSTNNSDIYLASGSTFTEANYLNAPSVIRGANLLGDVSDRLVAMAVHSDVSANLELNNLIDFIRQSDGTTIKTFRGMRLIIDQKMPVAVINSANVYSSYLFAEGAVAYGDGTDNSPIKNGFGTWGAEMGRVPLAHQNVLATRRQLVYHPRGVKYLDANCANGISSTNAELALSTNWLRVYEQQNIRIVRIRHNVDLT